MGLAQEDYDKIEQLIDQKIQAIPQKTSISYELDIRERTIRVEEELKHQRELMLEGFKQVEKRFQQVEKRFEQVDKRFEIMQASMDNRFAQVDKRFEQVDKRFEQVDKRFEQVDKHFEAIQLTMRWGLGILIAIAGLIATILKILV